MLIRTKNDRTYWVTWSTSPMTRERRGTQLANVRAPRDLGATRGYTHRGLTPGQLYTYRVFPEFESRYGFPGREDASPEEAALPARVEGLKVEPTTTNLGNHALKLTWNAVTNTGGHPVQNYLVQIATDRRHRQQR